MKIAIIATLLTIVLYCNADINESINQQLPLNSLARIPSPAQSLLPPTFENPIKDYTVGLVPPPIDGHPTTVANRPTVQQRQIPTQNNIRSTNTAEPYRSSVQQRSGYSAVHHHTHQFSNVVQPQVYQPKTTIYQPYQQPTAHHHYHHQQQRQHHSTSSSGAIVRQPVAAVPHHHHHNHIVSTPQYHQQVTQSRVHQHSTHTHYAPIPVQRAPTVLQHAHPSAQKSALVSRPVSSSGASIIQSYPSVSYAVTAPQHGSTLNFGNAKLDPELVHIISQVLDQNHS